MLFGVRWLTSQTPFRDGKRVLECLQKSLRIASSCIDELTSVQLYVDALDRYIYYFEQGVEAVTPKYINSLVELIVGNVDSISAPVQDGVGGIVFPSGGRGLSVWGGVRAAAPGGGGGPGLVEGVQGPDMVIKVCRVVLYSMRDNGCMAYRRGMEEIRGRD